jgi:predicted 3-demethylubiquinone-9 3-methyltransferase (glyoxalase superfamily)
MPRITPHLWFEKDAKAAAEFYVSIFGKDSKLVSANVLDNTPSGKVEIVAFELLGQRFMAISAGPLFRFNEAISFVVHCDTQAEIDYFWEMLSADSKAEQCGWLKDKFGLSWQVTPSVLGKMLQDPDPKKVARVTAAFLKMKKFDIAALERAYEGD